MNPYREQTARERQEQLLTVARNQTGLDLMVDRISSQGMRLMVIGVGEGARYIGPRCKGREFEKYLSGFLAGYETHRRVHKCQ